MGRDIEILSTVRYRRRVAMYRGRLTLTVVGSPSSLSYAMESLSVRCIEHVRRSGIREDDLELVSEHVVELGPLDSRPLGLRRGSYKKAVRHYDLQTPRSHSLRRAIATLEASRFDRGHHVQLQATAREWAPLDPLDDPIDRAMRKARGKAQRAARALGADAGELLSIEEVLPGGARRGAGSRRADPGQSADDPQRWSGEVFGGWAGQLRGLVRRAERRLGMGALPVFVEGLEGPPEREQTFRVRFALVEAAEQVLAAEAEARAQAEQEAAERRSVEGRGLGGRRNQPRFDGVKIDAS